MKILKNTTISEIFIEDTGINIPISPLTYTIQITDYLLWAASLDIITYINSGDIVVNDGTNDLSIAEGLRHIQYPETAANLRFDNSTNGFISKETQSAIEEAKAHPLIPEYESDPVSPATNEVWVKRDNVTGTPIGLLLCLTQNIIGYRLSYKTESGNIVRTNLS